MVDEAAVAGERGVGDGLHDVSVALPLVIGSARGAVQGGTLHHGGQGQLQVLAGQLRQRVLVRDDLALFGELDFTLEDAVAAGP